MQTKTLEIIRDVSDEKNRSVLQYSVLTSVVEDDNADVNFLTQDSYFLSLFRLVNESGHDVFHTDFYGRNVLHYASISGNYFAILSSFKFKHFYSSLKRLFRQKDIYDKTPFDIAFESMQKYETFQPLKLPNDCSLYEFFFTSCYTRFRALLSPHESVIFLMSQYIMKEFNFLNINITNLVITPLHKSRLYHILVLSTCARKEFLASLSTKHVSYLLSESNTPYLSAIILDTDGAINCGGFYSPLHRIVENKRNMLWKSSSNSYLDPLFEKCSNAFLSKCFDDQGFNLLHRAILGGHPITVRYLIRKGMDPFVLTKTNSEILTMSIISAPYTKMALYLCYTNCSRYHNIKIVYPGNGTEYMIGNKEHIDFDEISVFVLEEFYKLRFFNGGNNTQMFCNKVEKRLGLIHLAAAKGIISFLKKVRQFFGNDIIDCHDYFGVSSSYLAYIYKQYHILRWMESLDIDIAKPHRTRQLVLLYNLIDNYSSKQQYNWRCFVLPKYRFKALTRNCVLRCAAIDRHVAIFEQSPFKGSDYKWIFMSFSSRDRHIDFEDFEKTIISSGHNLNLRHTNAGSDRRFRAILERYFEVLDIYYRHHLMHRHNMEIYRKLLLFGSDDKRYLYHQILYHFNLCETTKVFSYLIIIWRFFLKLSLELRMNISKNLKWSKIYIKNDYTILLLGFRNISL